MSETAPPSLVGTVLSDRYRVDALLGEGGMGAVYVGEHQLMRKKVAIKVLHPDMMQVGEAVARFEREAMAAAHIEHPNVASATDFGRTPDGSFFLVLEYIEGKSLRHELAAAPVSIARSLHIAEQIAGALTRAHSLGIVHRDLKPENVMLCPRDGDPDFVKVLDFGIAKVPVNNLPGGASAPKGEMLTRMGVLYGTPEYMAPEQAMGAEVDHRADLYSMGVILYEMLCGLRPFDADDMVTLVTMQISEPPPPLGPRMPPGSNLPPEVEHIVLKLLAKERADRFQSSRELQQALASARHAMLGLPPPSVGPMSLGHPSSQGHQTAASPRPPGAAPTAIQTSPLPPEAPLSEAKTAFAPEVEHTPNAGAVQTAGAADNPVLRELKAALPEIERLRDQLPGPLAKAPLWAFPAALGAALLLAVITLALLLRSPSTEPAAAGPASSAHEAPTLTQDDIDKAIKAGPTAVEPLVREHPDDPRLARALVVACHEAKKPLDAVKALGRYAELSPAPAAHDELTIPVLKAAFDGSPEASEAAFTLLETGLGETGHEILFSLWVAKKDVNAKVQARAGKGLAKPEVKERLPKRLLALVELKTSTSCDAKRAAIAIAKEHGDVRAAALMKPLQAKKGCGFASLQDCWPCLRRDNLLNEAITAADARPEP